MPLLLVDALDGRPVPHHPRPNETLADRLARSDMDGQGPVAILLHGLNYRPGNARACPHRQLYSLRAEAREAWPRHLGFGTGHHAEGLALGFGWDARQSPQRAHAAAGVAGAALARLIGTTAQVWPGRPIHLLAHSMGSEVALSSLHDLDAPLLSRIILMTGASYRSRAEAALATPAGRGAEVINITSRENDLFDFLFERLTAAPRPGDRAIGHGLDAPNALTLQLDCPRTLAHLADLGQPIAAPRRRICHWSAYSRPGVLRLYSALMREADSLSLARLRQGLPERPAPRWSRLMPLPALPFGGPGPSYSASSSMT